MSARIWLSVFLGVLAGAASAYRLFNTFWHFGVLAGIAIGVAVAWIALAPVGFWREFVRQFAKLDESFRRWREERAAEHARIARMRQSWIDNVPDVLEVWVVIRVLMIHTIKYEVAVFQLASISAAIVSIAPEAKTLIALSVFFGLAAALATLGYAAGATLATWSCLRKRPSLIPDHFKPWNLQRDYNFTRDHLEEIMLLSGGATSRSMIKKMWSEFPLVIFFGWLTLLVWPVLKWLWPRGPIALKALGAAFRYTHSEAHRHVATHTAFGIAIGVWGFNAPILPLALISATVSVVVWHAVSKRVFQAA